MEESALYRSLGALTRDRERWRESIPYVASLLAHGSVKIRAKALWLLGEMGLEYPQSVQDAVPAIASFLDSPEALLRELRALLRDAVPEAEERMSWSMPTLWQGRNLIHFAASKKHLGLYPGGEATAVFAEELKDLEVSKGTIRLPWDRELPAALIRRIARWCWEAYRK